MHRSTRFAGAAAALTALLAVAPSFAESRQDVTDARRESQIWTTYTLNPHLRSSGLSVSVRGSHATLRGVVKEPVSRDLAGQIALGVEGVDSLDNQITVDATLVLDHEIGRGFGEQVDDASISAAVRSRLSWSKLAHGPDTGVSTLDGKVTLVGAADSVASRSFAGRLALDTRGVVAVDNRLVVLLSTQARSQELDSPLHRVGQGIADSWITAKVKSTFMYSDNVDSSSISVSTAEGVVTLSGKLASEVERALAIEFAQNVRGVKRVVATELAI